MNTFNGRITIMKKIFKNRKTRYRNLLFFIIPILIICGVFGYISYKAVKDLYGSAKGEEQTSQYSRSIESMGYYLRPNATSLQEDLFKELQDLIKEEANKEEIAACVAKNFVADFYTWSNKNGSYDIGGMHYIYAPSKNNVIFQARNTYYKYLTYYINTFGQDKMLEVTSVDATVEPSTYELDGKNFEAYFVTCKWNYKNDDTFKGLNVLMPSAEQDGKYYHYTDFATHSYFIVIINDNGRYEIVQSFGDN